MFKNKVFTTAVCGWFTGQSLRPPSYSRFYSPLLYITSGAQSLDFKWNTNPERLVSRVSLGYPLWGPTSWKSTPYDALSLSVTELHKFLYVHSVPDRYGLLKNRPPCFAIVCVLKSRVVDADIVLVSVEFWTPIRIPCRLRRPQNHSSCFPALVRPGGWVLLINFD